LQLRRQTEREQDDNIRLELDNQFAALRELIYAPDSSSSGSNLIPLGTREAVSRPLTDPDVVSSTIVNDDGDYDQHVRELAFDKRSKPKDRTKTEEELALEDKEALEKAERRRRKRMLGQNESDSEEEGTVKGKRKRGADDLDDDFDEGPGEWDGLGVGLDQTNTRLSEAGEEEDAEEDTETSENKSSDDGDAESDGDEFSQNSDEDHKDLVTLPNPPTGTSKGNKAAKHELPYTFLCPGSHEEFLQIIEDLDDEDVPTVVQRIRMLYHTSLGADNKFKLQVCKRAFITVAISSLES
jgi:nucleolar protein 14